MTTDFHNDTYADPEGRPQPPSEDQLALNFATENAERLRYIEAWAQWKVYDGRSWVTDTRRQVLEDIRTTCRQAAESLSGKPARDLESWRTIANVERICRGDPRLASTVAAWDPDIWQLNTPMEVQ